MPPYRCESLPAAALAGHCVVCGFHPGLEGVLGELIERSPSAGRGLVVVARDRPARGLPERAHWVRAEPTCETALEDAAVGSASLAIVFGSPGTERTPSDASVIAATVAVRRVARRMSRGPDPLRVVAVVADRRHTQVAVVAGADEVVDVGAAGVVIVAHTVARSLARRSRA